MPVVEIAAGKLQGVSVAGICSFKGVPYGAPPIGPNRFLPLEPPQPWAGVRDALAYTGHAWQLPNRPKRRAVLERLLGAADTTPEGEDCLILNSERRQSSSDRGISRYDARAAPGSIPPGFTRSPPA